jgi:hypothetical protein
MKRISPLALYAAVGAVLLCIIVVELLPDSAPPPEPVPVAAATPKPTEEPVDTPDDTEDDTPALLDRPLFDPSRKPLNSPKPVVDDTNPGPSDLPRLAGILIAPGTKRATFQNGQEDKPVTLSEGDDIAGWTVDQIALTGVTLTGPRGRQVLRPKYDPNVVPTEPVVPAKQAPPGQPVPRNVFPPPGNPNGPLTPDQRNRPPRPGMPPNFPRPGMPPNVPPGMPQPMPHPQIPHVGGPP